MTGSESTIKLKDDVTKSISEYIEEADVSRELCGTILEIVNKYVNKNLSEITDGTDYNYCPDCDERMPDEPLRDESRD